MRTILTAAAIGLVSALLVDAPAVSQDKSSWSDFLGPDLKGWSYLGTGKNPWKYTTDRVLSSESGTSRIAPDRELGDGTLHVEWRFRPDSGKKVFKASVSVRNEPGGASCKVALGENCGSISATVVASSDRQKTIEEKAPKDHSLPVGEWNTLELKLEGRNVTAVVNGKVTTSFGQCDTDRGFAALEAEGCAIEFRKVMWK